MKNARGGLSDMTVNKSVPEGRLSIKGEEMAASPKKK